MALIFHDHGVSLLVAQDPAKLDVSGLGHVHGCRRGALDELIVPDWFVGLVLVEFEQEGAVDEGRDGDLVVVFVCFCVDRLEIDSEVVLRLLAGNDK